MKTVYLFILLFASNILSAQNNVVDIRNFAVNGLDDKDDTEGFDRAVEFLCKNGGTLYIPNGDYILNNYMRKRIGIHHNQHIFLISKDIKILFAPRARLCFKNNFKGFRFRSTEDPNDNTINKFNLYIEGGIIDASENFQLETKGNPDMWCFVAETVKKFSVNDLTVKDFKGTAAVASYSNNAFEVLNCNFINVTGNPNDKIDNHGDAIYASNTSNYKILKNVVTNELNIDNRIGRIGICIEYEKSYDGVIEYNLVSGYDRGLHIELIKGTAVINNNKLVGNNSGIVLWNNYGNSQVITNNYIANKGLSNSVQKILYTSAPILMLGYNTNNNSLVKKNKIVIEKEFCVPDEILQVTSTTVKVVQNIFIDKTRSLSLVIGQGLDSKQKVEGIKFLNNQVIGGAVYAYDVSNIDISDNEFRINEMVLSFDKSLNFYRNNKLEFWTSIPILKFFGTYKTD